MDKFIINLLGFCCVLMLLVCTLKYYIITLNSKKEMNKFVHLYVARDENDELFLYMGKPFRGINKFHPCQNGCIITSNDDLSNFGLNKDDYANLKWEDEPVEVFLNMEKS